MKAFKKLILLFLVVLAFFLVESCKKRVRLLYPGGINIESPVIRVGLVLGEKNVIISSTSGLKIYFRGQKVFENILGVVEFNLNNGAITIQTGKETQILKGDLFILPEKGSFLKIGENEYRGIFLLLNRGEYLNLVNILNIEEYLRGVLPYELSPSIYGEIEALKAQAVASRTYALFNLKKFEQEGYDICATQDCQVYKGKSGETALTDKAVEDTKGEVLIFGGKLIASLYSASCGGFTESAKKMFKGMGAPYLISQHCEYDDIKWYWVYTDNFKPYSMELDLALAINLVDEFDLRKGNNKIPPDRASPLLKKVAVLMDKDIDFFLKKVTIHSLLEPFDKFFSIYIKAKEEVKPFELPNPLIIKYGKRYTYMIQYLLKKGVINKKDNLEAPLSFNKFVSILSTILMKNFKIFEDVNFVSLIGYELTLKDKNGNEIKLNVESPILLRKIKGKIYPAHMLFLTGKEKIKVFRVKDNLKMMIVEYPDFSLKPDSFYPFWHKAYTLKELERTIRKFTPIAKLYDIVSLKRGESGRVIKLEIQDENKSYFVYGYQIKRALDLRDTLFFIDREFDNNGIKRITFIGRGWGHGVGMCQVGAYGMALKGRKYKEILNYYYPSTQLVDYFDLVREK